MKSAGPALLYLALLFPVLGQGTRTLRPALLDTVSSAFSVSSRERMADGRSRDGEVGVNRFDLNVAGVRAWRVAGAQFAYGLAYSRTELDAEPVLLVPETLQELSLSLGVRRELSAKWGFAAYLRPGFYGDFERFDQDSFNVPLLLLTSYRESATRAWFFGMNANAFSDHPVLPAFGLRWEVAPNWTFDLGYPRTSLLHTWGEELKVGVGVSAQGGNYRVTESLGVPALGVRRLANTYLDYSEYRAGFRLEKALGRTFIFDLEFGVLIEREFDFFDRDYEFDGSGGLYAGLALRGRR